MVVRLFAGVAKNDQDLSTPWEGMGSLCLVGSNHCVLMPVDRQAGFGG